MGLLELFSSKQLPATAENRVDHSRIGMAAKKTPQQTNKQKKSHAGLQYTVAFYKVT